MRIVHLFEVPEMRTTLAEWFVETWEPWYGPAGDGDAHADLAAARTADALPLCRVALSGDGSLLGTASLRATSVGSDIAPGPWLSAVLVAQDQRGRGIGTMLVAAIEDDARRLGHGALYVSTDVLQASLIARGWTRWGDSQSLRGAVDVLVRDLSATT